MNFDSDQEQAISATGNIVISAGAGSGKTTVLAERYLSLVRDHRVPVRSILTLTFTRKAAFEMRERIYKRLRAEHDDPAVRDQLTHFEEAQISTMDSFCAQIVREAGSAYGVPPDFALDEEENRALAEDVALRFLLDHAEEPVLVRLIAVNGFSATWRDLLASVVHEVLSLAGSADFNTLVDTQMGTLKRRLQELCDAAEERAAHFLSFESGSGDALRKRQERVAAFDFEPFKAGARALLEGGNGAGLNEMAQGLSVLADIDKKFGNSKREDIEEIKDAVDRLKEVVDEAQSVVQSLLMEEDFRRLFALLAEFEERVLAEKRSRGVFTYRDVVELAIRILKEQHEFRRYYVARFRHIMIDEFQDNNEEQKHLLYLLCSSDLNGAPEQKLFFVGDDKQSIYRFRGADVSVFRRLATELATQGGRHIRLDNNYRSDPRLIDFFNKLFETVLAGSDAEEYEAAFLPLHAKLPAQPPTQPASPILRVCVKEESDESEEESEGEQLSRHEAEAYHVARTVKSLVEEQGLRVADGDGDRPLRYDDVALLMRSTSNQNLFEGMFRLFDVPYSTQSVRSLFQEAPVYDIYNILQLAVYPEDRSAYAAFLRSPFCNLSDAGLAMVMMADAPPFSGAGVPAAGTEIAAAPAGAAALSEEDAHRFAAAAELYREIAGRIDREDSEVLVRRLWYDYGYRYWLMRRPGNHPYLEYIDYLVELCGLVRSGSVVELLDLIRENLGEYRRMAELDVLQRRNDGVQIMTIHKSKGLEFPVVILANSGNVGRREGTGTRPFYNSSEYGLTINMPAGGSKDRYNYFFRIGQAEEEARELAEIKRLFYVALTRAQNHVIVSGVRNSRNRSGDRDHLGMILDAVGYDPETGNAEPARLSPHLEIEEIPDVPRTALLRGAARAAGDPLAVAAAYQARPTVERRYRQREFTATALNAHNPALHPAGAAAGGAATGGTADLGQGGTLPAGAVAANEAVTAGGEALPALESDGLLADSGLENAFGTLCHWLIEQQLAGVLEAGPGVSPRDVPVRLLEGFSEEAAGRVVRDATRLVSAFFDSEIGRYLTRAASEERTESELPLLLRRDLDGEQVLIRGSADLVVVNDEAIELFDFKTDRYVQHGYYDVQVSLYAEAAAELYNRPVQARVLYLRRPAVESPLVSYPCPDRILAACIESCRSREP